MQARVAHSLADTVLVLGRGVSAARTSCTCSQTCPTHTSPVTLRQYVCARSALCVYALQELTERRMCPQYEDFGSSDASRLDTWTFDNVTSLFQQATSCVQTRRVWLACCCSSRHEIQRHGCVPCACAACARVRVWSFERTCARSVKPLQGTRHYGERYTRSNRYSFCTCLALTATATPTALTPTSTRTTSSSSTEVCNRCSSYLSGG